MSRLRQSSREGLGIILCATVLGFAVTAIRDKGVFAGESPATSATRQPPGDSPTMIHLPQAIALYESGQGLFIDARHALEYRRGHIRGAINLPLHEFEIRRSQVDSLPRDKVLITYCDGVECNSSIGLAARLREAGFSGVKIFFAGWNEWQQQNLPSEGAGL